MSSSPNLFIRFGYLIVLITPLIKRVELFPAVIICMLGISKNTFAYPIMPTEMHYYIILSLLFCFIAKSRHHGRIAISPLFIVVLLYVAINSYVFQQKFSTLVSTLFLCIMFFVCMKDKEEVGNQWLSFSFIFISLTISYWLLFRPEAQVQTYNTVGEMEQLGWTDPNYLASVLGVGCVLSVKELLSGGKKVLYRSVLFLTIIGSVFALLQLASRGMILAVSIGVSFLVLFSRIKWLPKLLIVVLSVLFVVLLYTNQYLDFVIARFEMDDGTGSGRTIIWSSKLIDFFRKGNLLNFIFGVGQAEGYRLGGYFGDYNFGQSTHNDFVSVLINFGFVGVILFLSVIFYPIRICSKQVRFQIIALLIYLIICSMTIEPIAQGSIVYLGFFFYIIQLARQSQQKINNHE